MSFRSWLRGLLGEPPACPACDALREEVRWLREQVEKSLASSHGETTAFWNPEKFDERIRDEADSPGFLPPAIEEAIERTAQGDFDVMAKTRDWASARIAQGQAPEAVVDEIFKGGGDVPWL